MEKEETYILNQLPDNDKDRIRILKDHNELRELINQLKAAPDKISLTAFADKLEKHVRYEERSFFPRIQLEFSAEVLKSMHPAERKVKEQNGWKDAFWL